MILTSPFHTPVLLFPLLAALRIKKGRKYIDATIGGGGYAFELLKLGAVVLGIDRDQEAINHVKEKLEDGRWKVEERKNLYLVHGNFADLKEIAHSNGFEKVAGIIFDLGMSSYQLEASGRGFSYNYDEPLDMRMDISQKQTAADLLNSATKERLYEIFSKFGEELHSRAIAEAIVRARSVKGEITRTSEVSQLIDDVIDRIYSKDYRFKIHQATKARIFQALRIAVNNELENLERGLTHTIDLLDVGGRIAVLSYHSLEDRCVKLIFKQGEKTGRLKMVTADPLQADRVEREKNPKSKSAELRVAEKLV